MKSSNQLYISGIDHLRAVAALLVLFYHTIHSGNLVPQSHVPAFPPLSLLEEGHTGVALFITITGFIFTTIIGDNRISYPRFLFNRFVRIFPLLFVLSLFAAFVTEGVKDADPLALLKMLNLFGGGVYWGTWTLVVEFQFYLFFPVFYVYCRDNWLGPGKKYLPFAGLMLLALGFRLVFFSQSANAQDIGYWTIFGRIDQFMLGAMACLLLKDMEKTGQMLKPVTGLLVFLVAVVLLVVVYHQLNTLQLFVTDPPSSHLLWLVVPTIEGLLYAAMLLGWVVFSRVLLGRVSKVFAYIGAISYSTYLIHFAVLLFCLRLVNNYSLQFSEDVFVHKMLMAVLLVYPITLGLSVLSYEFIEKPFFHRRLNYILPQSGT